MNVIGALGYATGAVWHDLHGKPVKRDAVVVLDNARTHHHIDPEKLDEWRTEHRLVLVHLPPYSPELNPIEIVWKHLKYHWRHFVTWSKEELFEQVQNLMAGVGLKFKIRFS